MAKHVKTTTTPAPLGTPTAITTSFTAACSSTCSATAGARSGAEGSRGPRQRQSSFLTLGCEAWVKLDYILKRRVQASELKAACTLPQRLLPQRSETTRQQPSPTGLQRSETHSFVGRTSGCLLQLQFLPKPRVLFTQVLVPVGCVHEIQRGGGLRLNHATDRLN